MPSLDQKYENMLLNHLTRIQGPLCELPHFCPQMVKWCSMHCVNLGICLWVTGSVLRTLADDYDVWARMENDNVNARLAHAYGLFRQWTRENKIQHLNFD